MRTGSATDTSAADAAPPLELTGVNVSFGAPGGTRVPVLNGVDLRLEEGETLGLVGESGSGKSVTALSVLRLLGATGRIDSGTIRYRGKDLAGLGERQLRSIRGREIAMIFQDPVASLNPAFTVGAQIAEVVEKRSGTSKREARTKALGLLSEVGLSHPERRIDQYPHEFSGGMCQRIVIALALASEPSVLLADEPTTALDVTTQAQILRLLQRLATDRSMSTIFTTHDLALVSQICDRVAVMYAGRVVEIGPLDEVYSSPRHPYTQALLECALGVGIEGGAVPIQGAPPTPLAMPTGCPFHPRCRHAVDRCHDETPLLMGAPGVHPAACHLAESLHLEGVGA